VLFQPFGAAPVDPSYVGKQLCSVASIVAVQ
jgi:hypothetical protein